MSGLKVAVAAAGLLLAASPCLAFTVIPSTANEDQKARLANSEDATGSAGANLQDTVVRNSLTTSPASAPFVSGAPYGSTNSSFNFGGFSGSSQVTTGPNWSGFNNGTGLGSAYPAPVYFGRRR